MAPSEPNSKVKPIAIIAVHGVADQLPHDSARQISQMLLEHSRNNDHRPYESFIEQPFHIPEQRFEFRLDSPPQNTSYSFLHEQLTPSQNDSTPETLRPWSSIRLEGDRKASADSKLKHKQPIHIYEMYWADISRLQNEFLRIFSEFYQILFHLSRIGRRSVTQVQQDVGQTNAPLWKLYASIQTAAEWCMTVGIPLINMFMLITALTIVPLRLKDTYLNWIAAGTVFIALSLIIGEIFWRWPEKPLAGLTKPKSIGSMIILLVAALCFFIPSLGIYHYAAIITASLFCLVLLVGAKNYNQRRPHSLKWAKRTAIAWGGLFLFFILRTTYQGPTLTCEGLSESACQNFAGIIQASLNTVELLFIPLISIWVIFNWGQIIAALLGFLLSRFHQDKTQQTKIKKSAWIARLSLSAPSALFLLVTLALWYAIASVSQSLIPEGMTYTPLISQLFIGGETLPTQDFIHNLIVAAATSSFPLVLIAVILALLIGIYALLPSIGAELFPRNYAHRSPVTERLRQWLNNGLTGLYFATEIITIGMLVFSLCNLLLLVLELLQLVPIDALSQFAIQSLAAIAPYNKSLPTQTVLNILFILIASSATSLVALGSRLAKFTSGIRNLLDVVLDVDNYLRVNPTGHNPKARIFNRYTSLLRYIHHGANPKLPHQDYGAIIIIAHSQGTVISADVLRVLTRTYATPQSNTSQDLNMDAELDPSMNPTGLPVYLYTMGSPLKQLYNNAFPCLYDWMDHLDHLQSFGLKHWKNTYCTGDYVGRSLWDNPVESPPAGFKEQCLGAGAHTHYWDNTFPEVAQSLDQMILELAQQLQAKAEG